jgi:hypothetical protein
VTNAFETKTAEGLERISGNILASEATTVAVAEKLVEACRRLRNGHNRAEPVNLPLSWDPLADSVDLVVNTFGESQRCG